jgi:hypothetical protein
MILIRCGPLVRSQGGTQEKGIKMSDDPIEFVGRDRTIKADTVPVRKSAPKPVAAALVEELAAPTPEVKKPGSHPKFAIKAPRLAYEAAQQEVMDAQSELRDATNALNAAEKALDEALTHFQSLQVPPSPEDLRRDYVNSEVAKRAANVAAGLAPNPALKPQHNRSPIDTQAAQRMRTSPHMPGASPLRSNVPRRNIV